MKKIPPLTPSVAKVNSESTRIQSSLNWIHSSLNWINCLRRGIQSSLIFSLLLCRPLGLAGTRGDSRGRQSSCGSGGAERPSTRAMDHVHSTPAAAGGPSSSRSSVWGMDSASMAALATAAAAAFAGVRSSGDSTPRHLRPGGGGGFQRRCSGVFATLPARRFNGGTSGTRMGTS